MRGLNVCGLEDGIASWAAVRQVRHPSRLPFGSLRSAWTGPAGPCARFPGTRQCHPLFASLDSF